MLKHHRGGGRVWCADGEKSRHRRRLSVECKLRDGRFKVEYGHVRTVP